MEAQRFIEIIFNHGDMEAQRFIEIIFNHGGMEAQRFIEIIFNHGGMEVFEVFLTTEIWRYRDLFETILRKI